MDIFRLLKKDHASIKALLEEITQTTDRAVKKRTRLFTQLKREFHLHATLEEQLFYPLFSGAGKKDHFQALEAEEEHQAVRLLIKEIDRTPPDHERWLPRVMVLKENIEHHIAEEEKNMFKRGRQIMARGQPAQLGEEAATYKEEHARG